MTDSIQVLIATMHDGESIFFLFCGDSSDKEVFYVIFETEATVALIFFS